MAYYLVRMYSGSGDRPLEDILNNVVMNELLPKLKEAGGLQRYATGFREDDKGLVSASFYDTKENALKGLEVARQWVSETRSLQGFQLRQTLQGEIIGTNDGDAQGEARYGAARIFATDADADTCFALMRQYAPATQGRLRTTFVRLDDGRVGAFNVYTSEEARQQHREAVRKLRLENEEVKKVLPNDPEDINFRIVAVADV